MFGKTLIVVAAVQFGHAGSVAFGQESREPADRNAALEYWPNWHRLEIRDDDELVDRAHEFGNRLWQSKRGEADQPLPTPEGLEPESELVGWMDEIQSLLDNLGVASEARTCDFGLRRQDGPNMEIAHVGPMRKWFRVLALDARRHTDAGRPDVAARRIATIIRMSEHLTQSGDTISRIFALGAIGYATSESTWLMSKGGGDVERAVLLDAIDRFGEGDPFQSIKVLRHERAMAAEVPNWLRSGGLAKLFGSLDLVDQAKDGASPEEAEAGDTQLLVALAEQYLSDDPEQEAKDMQRAWDEVIDAWDQPDAAERLREIEKGARVGDFGPAARMMGPQSAVRMWHMDQHGRTNLEALRALLDVEKPDR